jgi:hypothetical protein
VTTCEYPTGCRRTSMRPITKVCIFSSSNRGTGPQVGLGAFLLLCILGASAWVVFVAIGTDWDAWLGTLGVHVVAPLMFIYGSTVRARVP